MKQLFWSSLFLIVITYAGYPAWLYIRARFWPRAVQRRDIFPHMTILLAVRNEQKVLPAKLQNLAALNYPADRLEVIVVSDGSTDATNAILDEWTAHNRRPVILREHCGKSAALNRGVAEATGEIIVFTDARQRLAPDALKQLAAYFADASVGCVSGELLIQENHDIACAAGMGLYWQIEKWIRQSESLAGSAVGASGALYAAQKRLVVPLPNDTILDDVYIPLQVIHQGYRSIFAPLAVAYDDLAPGPREEFARKVRTLTGNYQLLRLLPWLLTPSNPVLFEFVFHKLSRLLIPFALLGFFAASLFLNETPYRIILVFETMLVVLAAIGGLRPKLGFVSRFADISLAFLLLNTAAAVAFFYFISGKKRVWA